MMTRENKDEPSEFDQRQDMKGGKDFYKKASDTIVVQREVYVEPKLINVKINGVNKRYKTIPKIGRNGKSASDYDYYNEFGDNKSIVGLGRSRNRLRF